MPTPSPIFELVDWLNRSTILTDGEAHQLRRTCEKAGTKLTREKIIAGLEERQKITPYQASEIRAGRQEELIRGNYLLLQLIRSSNMGVVYKARQMSLGWTVALKFLPNEVAQSPEAEARFKREVAAIAKLDHPRIVAASDAGRIGRTLFLAMKFLPGENLGDYVLRHGPLGSVEEALNCILQAAEGLAVAHAAGIIHRDIKPGNLMLMPDGTLKVLDLGLAKFLCEEPGRDGMTASSELTGQGILGTVDYMAPEQIRESRTVDKRADIYGLGCTLYFLLAGRPPTPDGDLPAKIGWHLNGLIPRLADVRADASPAAQEVLSGMLARDVDLRYGSCEELIRAIKRALQEGSSSYSQSVEPPPVSHSRKSEGGNVLVSTPVNVNLDTIEGHGGKADTTPGGLIPAINTALAKPQKLPTKTATPSGKTKLPPWVWIAAGAGGVLGVSLLVFLAILFMSDDPNQAVAQKPEGNSEPKSSNGRSFKKSKPATPSDKPPIRITPNSPLPGTIKWNLPVKQAIDEHVVGGTDKMGGGLLYSEIDTAMEGLVDADWYLGGLQSVSQQPIHLQVLKGKFSVRVVSPIEADRLKLSPRYLETTSLGSNSLPRRIVVNITDFEMHVDVFKKDGTKRIRGSISTEARVDLRFERVVLHLELTPKGQPDAETEKINFSLDWDPTQTLPHTFQSPRSQLMENADITYKLYGWVWEPKPGYVQISQEETANQTGTTDGEGNPIPDDLQAGLGATEQPNLESK